MTDDPTTSNSAALGGENPAKPVAESADSASPAAVKKTSKTATKPANKKPSTIAKSRSKAAPKDQEQLAVKTPDSESAPKPAVKKTTAKKPASNKPAAKTPAKKAPSAKAAAAVSAPTAEIALPKQVAPEKALPAEALVEKVPAKKAPVKTAAAKTALAKKASAKKTPAKKTPAKEASAKTKIAPTKKASASKTVAKSPTAKPPSSTSSTAKPASAKKTSVKTSSLSESTASRASIVDESIESIESIDKPIAAIALPDAIPAITSGTAPKQPAAAIPTPSTQTADKKASPALNKEFLLDRARVYWRLARMDKPIGALLLLWPTLWALWLAAEGFPRWDLLIIFVLGVFVMRAAGCVINDFADRKVDGRVKRTQGRPLATGEASSREAVGVFIALCLVAFGLVLLTDKFTIYLSLGGLLLAFCYPFMKRHTHLPQVVLGAAFAWGIPMAFAAQTGSVEPGSWLLYTTVVLWTVVYDTFYAMVDRDDDLRIGVKSTAVLFGEQDRVITAILQAITVYALVLVGSRFELGGFYYAGVTVAAALFVYQQYLIRFRGRTDCFRAFMNNNWVGAAIFVGIVLNYWL